MSCSLLEIKKGIHKTNVLLKDSLQREKDIDRRKALFTTMHKFFFVYENQILNPEENSNHSQYFQSLVNLHNKQKYGYIDTINYNALYNALKMTYDYSPKTQTDFTTQPGQSPEDLKYMYNYISTIMNIVDNNINMATELLMIIIDKTIHQPIINNKKAFLDINDLEKRIKDIPKTKTLQQFNLEIVYNIIIANSMRFYTVDADKQERSKVFNPYDTYIYIMSV